MKNIEKIKKMSIDNLAELIQDMAKENSCYYCAYYKTDKCADDCKTGIKEWLDAEE